MGKSRTGTSRITILLALGATFLSAEGAEPPKPKAEAGASVTVTAEATPVEVVKTPNPMKVLDVEAIQESGARTLDELLPELLPGQIQPYGGAGTGSTLYLGGGRAQDVVVTLDGIRVTDPSSLNPSFSDFSLEGIDRVEVLQGPASTRFGSDTHGGVIALYSAGPSKEGFSGSASLAAGNRDLRSAQAAPAFGWNGGWVRASVSASSEDQSIPADDPFRTTAGALNLGQRVGEDGLFTLTYRNHYRGTPLPFASDYAPPTYAYTRVFDPARQDTERDQDLVGAYRQVLGTAWLLETSFGHVAQDRMEPGMMLGEPSDRYRGQRNQAVGSLTWTPVKGLQGNLLLDHAADSADLRGDRATGAHDAAALELAYEWELGLRAVASGRYQKDSIEYTLADGSVLPQRDSHRFVYKGGLNWMVGAGFRLYASYGTSYNAPDLFKLTWNYPNHPGYLDNEISRGVQTGASLTRGPWEAKVEASRTLYNQVLNWVPLGLYDGYYANGTNLRVQGVEGSLAYAGKDWRLEGFARSQEARNESELDGQQLTTSGATGRPFFTGGLRGSLTWGDWRLAGRWTYTGSSYQYFDDFAGVDGERTHFNDVALALTWSPWKPWSFGLRGEHLLQRTWSREDWLAGGLMRKNDAYLVPVFPVAGPTFSLEAKYRF